MNASRAVELAVGLFVVLGVAAIFFLALRATDMTGFQGGESYPVEAYFDNIGGLTTGAPVRVAGVRVGTVKGIEYAPDAYQARVTLQLSREYEFPMDTTASIYTEGLLGENYIALDPGGVPQPLTEGDRITITQSAMVLEELVGQFLFDGGSGSGSDSGGAQ
ncbi:phospholipid/cholesterol/gamma-HCH transport system substrate-binding protein [Thiohalospira halophila DSM 15071]|uniref:Phospholipid/cholesterol/gamma-HCH transport system substrate-binding protein n=1 Tax=Thiohalospira halophila DSM 15071 TaxID=1123397 RepID=A0A1I1QUA8_9GAMM|nr:outer membrane lipid asymmetry maintenance protein MlaD [Thiohalospira halophila]SFD25592.1 phospholipid/cholesterol/gamma-HCH transport system substrate-binding protein [Thiohalospira halophila DSM 15071]